MYSFVGRLYLLIVMALVPGALFMNAAPAVAANVSCGGASVASPRQNDIVFIIFANTTTYKPNGDYYECETSEVAHGSVDPRTQTLAHSGVLMVIPQVGSSDENIYFSFAPSMPGDGQPIQRAGSSCSSGTLDYFPAHGRQDSVVAINLPTNSRCDLTITGVHGSVFTGKLRRVRDGYSLTVIRLIVPDPDMVVSGAGVEISNGDSTPQVADNTDFGWVAVGATKEHTFEVSNKNTNGMLILPIDPGSGSTRVQISDSTNFTVSRDLQPAGRGNITLPFRITFTPRSAGTKTATVTILSNDPNKNPYTFVIQGGKRTLTPASIELEPQRPKAGETGVRAVIKFSGPLTPSLSGTADITISGTGVENGPVNCPRAASSSSPSDYTFICTFNIGAAGRDNITVTLNSLSDPNYQGSGSERFSVDAADASIVFEPALSSATVGTPTTITAKVTAPGAGNTVPGSVTFSGLPPGANCPGSIALTPTATADEFIASCTFTPSQAGVYTTIGAAFTASSTNYNDDSITGQSLSVDAADASIVFEPALSSATVGTPTTITAKVTAPGAGNTVPGSVTFSGLPPGANCPGSIALTPTATADEFIASCTFTPSQAGVYTTIGAAFTASSTNYNDDSITGQSLSVDAADASIVFEPALSSATVGTPTTITAKVTAPGAGNTVPGSVTFSGLPPGANCPGSIALTPTATADEFIASCTFTPSQAGVYTTIGAAFTASSTNYNDDSITGQSLSVDGADASIVFEPALSSATVGTPTTITAKVTAPGAGNTVPGSVTFSGLPPGANCPGSIALTPTATADEFIASCTFTPSQAGVYTTIGAAFTASSTNYNDDSITGQSLTVNRAAVRVVTTIGLDPSEPEVDRQVTMRITFSRPAGVPFSGTFDISLAGTGSPAAAIGATDCKRTGNIIPPQGGTFTCTFTPTSPGELNLQVLNLADPRYTFAQTTVSLRVTVIRNVARLTTQMVVDYLGDRNAILLANGVNMNNRLNRLSKGRGGQMGGNISVNLGRSEDATASAFSMDLRTFLPGDVSITGDTITFAASTIRLMRSGAFGADSDDRDVGESVLEGGDDRGAVSSGPRWDVWIEGRISRFDSSSNDGTLGVVYLGADYLITPSMLIGLMTQYDWLKKDYDTNGRIKGQGWMVGPYAAARLDERLFLEVQVRGGRSSNDITPIGTYTDRFKTTRWYVSGRLNGDFDYGDWTIRPGVSAQYLAEKQKGYTDSLGNSIAARTISQGDIRVGPRVAYTYGLGDGGAIIPWAEFEGVYTFGSKDKFSTGGYAFDIHGLSGSVEAGLDWRTATGAVFSLSGSYDGIGSGSSSYGARARVDIAF